MEAKELSTVLLSELLANWDTAYVDLYRDNGKFSALDIRLRNCELHYSEFLGQYHVRYRNVTYGVNDIYNLTQKAA